MVRTKSFSVYLFGRLGQTVFPPSTARPLGNKIPEGIDDYLCHQHSRLLSSNRRFCSPPPRPPDAFKDNSCPNALEPISPKGRTKRVTCHHHDHDNGDDYTTTTTTTPTKTTMATKTTTIRRLRLHDHNFDDYKPDHHNEHDTSYMIRRRRYDLTFQHYDESTSSFCCMGTTSQPDDDPRASGILVT